MDPATVIASIALVIGFLALWVVGKQLALQTVGTIFTLVQNQSVRDARRQLFKQEENCSISELPICEWHDEWKLNADIACQAFNTAAVLLRHNSIASFLTRNRYIRDTQRIIIKIHQIALPQIEYRRNIHQSDLWHDFDWLLDKANKTPEAKKNAEKDPGFRA